MNLYTAAQMRETDRRAIQERGIPSVELMENAAQALVAEIRSLPIPGPGFQSGAAAWFTRDGQMSSPEDEAEFWALRQRSAVVFCGPGNNGGDGVAAARLLLEAGWRVRCVLVGDRTKMTADCLEMERRLSQAGGTLEDFNPEDAGRYIGYDVAVDALFGVGLNSPLRLDAATAALRMAASGWVVSADVPSGVHADTGDVAGMAVRAHVTVTFSQGKPGLYVGQGAVHSGRVVVADIGIPGEAYPERPQTVLVGREDLYLAPRRVDGHKGDFGKLFILAGSRGYTGAAALCARAAVRSGVGLTTLAVPEDVYPILAAKCCDEVMVWPWAESGDEIVEKAKGCTAAVIGPGLGQGGRAEELVLMLLRELTCPVILDADGLNIISRHIDVLDEREGLTVLTPHDGEFARLSGCELPIRDRLGAARSLAAERRCVVVLKGHRTVTATENGVCAVNSTGNPGMAKGGSGDVLAGLMGGLLAQGGGLDEAAKAVWLHGRAGDLAAEDRGEHGMTPSDLIERLPDALKELAGQNDALCEIK